MIETNVTVLNEISAKLGGKADATLVVEALNNIANAMGDNEPDKLKTVSEALADILEYAGGGGSSAYSNPILTVKVVNSSGSSTVVGSLNNAPYINDDSLETFWTEQADGTTEEYAFLIVYDNIDDRGYYFDLSMMVDDTSNVSDVVNLQENDGLYTVIDPTQPASLTVTIS